MGCGERICLLFAISGQTVTWAPGFPPGNRGEGERESRRSPLPPGNSAAVSPGQAQAYSLLGLQPLIEGNRQGFGCKRGPRRTREAKGGRSDEGPPLRRWNRRQGEEELIPGAHQAAPPARYLVLVLASSPGSVSAPPPWFRAALPPGRLLGGRYATCHAQ
uniref:Uncharacterized protein n=1 Tax=Rangifer tarandus platyrhynchus TaxID=3082113 RepID=A0ACB0EJ09_RANTA|nr:unnamed protein product [Rangifer tarandus platyrhynchus]